MNKNMIKNTLNRKKNIILGFLFLICSLTLKAEQSQISFDEELTAFKTVALPNFPNIKVPIYKSEGLEGPGVLFIHGNSSSSRAFYKQLDSDFGRKYKLFFMDLPGHGMASKVDPSVPMPTTEDGTWPTGFKEYQEGVLESVELVANDPEVLAEIIVGWSMGGDVAINTIGSNKLPNVKGLYIFGTAPADKNVRLKEAPFRKSSALGALGMPLLPGIGLSFEFTLSLSLFRVDSKFTDPMPWYAPAAFDSSPSRGMSYLRAFFSPFVDYSNLPEFILEDGFNRSDDRFRTSLAAIALQLDPEREHINELEILRTFESRNIKIAVGAGKHDLFLNLRYLSLLHEEGYLNTLWNSEIVIFEDAGHSPQLETSEAFNASVEEFIKSFN